MCSTLLRRGWRQVEWRKEAVVVQGACPGPCFDVGRADEAEFPRDLGVGQRPCDSVWVVPRGVRGIGRRRPAADEWICTLWQAGLTVSIHAQVVTNPADLAALSLKASNDVATVFRRSHWRSTSSARSASTPPAEWECFDASMAIAATTRAGPSAPLAGPPAHDIMPCRRRRSPAPPLRLDGGSSVDS